MVAPARLYAWRFRLVTDDDIRSGFVLARSIAQAKARAAEKAKKLGGEAVGILRHCRATVLELDAADLIFAKPPKLEISELMEMLHDECRKTQVLTDIQAIKVQRIKQFNQTKG